MIDNKFMDIIMNYEETKPIYNLLYLAKPVYGGWVTFTAHLSKKYNYPIFKISKRSEKNKREFGYDCQYQNLELKDILQKPNLLITAVDKHYWRYLQYFSKNTKLVIHDPTEVKMSKQGGNPLVQETDIGNKLLTNFYILTIRESVRNYLFENYKIHSEFKRHPFYKYNKNKNQLGYKNVSISRIDFDKNTDIILKANMNISDKKKHIYCFGAENRLYVHHKLGDLNFEEYWKGKFKKTFEPNYEEKSILEGAEYMIDLSVIKKDGGGTQYTFLEAIYRDCVLILHKEWINKGNLFKDRYNCIAVSNELELAKIINQGIDKQEYNKILKNSKSILDNHINIEW